MWNFSIFVMLSFLKLMIMNRNDFPKKNDNCTYVNIIYLFMSDDVNTLCT
jgi:hypothetical protein